MRITRTINVCKLKGPTANSPYLHSNYLPRLQTPTKQVVLWPRSISHTTATTHTLRIRTTKARITVAKRPTAMVHYAFDAVELVRGAPSKVEAAASYGSKILAGCTDGSLRIFAPGSESSDREIRREPYVLERTVGGFWKKAPSAMEVLGSRDLLLSLSEWIVFHRLPSLETLAAIGRTKGANVYAWDDRRGMLCVGRQKRVVIYRLDGGREFVEVRDFGVSDYVKSMAWCGENICLGIRKEYVILNSTTGASTQVFPSGRMAPPLVVSLTSGELLLGKDNIGIFVDQTGKLLQDGRICWSESPGSVVIHRPYAIAHLPRHVEIRSLRTTYPLVQTVVLRDVHLLVQSNNCVIAALGNSIYGLFPVPLGAQIVQLTASGDFEEALALCKMLPPEDSALRSSKESSIHMRYGHYLFENGNYEEASEQFLASQVDITYVLSLYPSMVLPKSSVSYPEKMLEMTGASVLSGVSSDSSDLTESSFLSQHIEFDEKSTHEERKLSHNAFMALVKYLQKKRSSIIERATAEVTNEVVLDAVDSSNLRRPKASAKNRVSYHIGSVAREMAIILDTALLQALLLTGQNSVALELLKGPNYCDLKICEDSLKQRNSHELLLELYKCNGMYREALDLLVRLVEESKSDSSVQTSGLTRRFQPDMIIEYLKPVCATDPMLVLEFSTHVLESCPTQTIDLFLFGNIPADLVNSYLKQHAPNMQSRYLELMLSLNDNEATSNLQNELVQIYLSEVLDWYKDLHNQQKWEETACCPTRKKLLSALEGISGYNAEGLLKRLPQDALYEERAILLGRMNQHQVTLSLYVHKLHGPDMALAYCDRVFESGLHQPNSRATANIYLTLLQIYLYPQKATKILEQRTSSTIQSLSSFSQKVGVRKTKASRLLKKIVEIEGADDVRISPSSTDSGRSDGDGDGEEIVYEGGHVMLNDVLNLLSKRWDRMNGAQALRLLPKETKLQDLLLFLEPLLKKSSEGHRNYSVIKNLRYSENLQVKEELHKHQKEGLKIDNESTCSLCRKKIGGSVFVIYPSRKTVVHFVCFRDSQRLRL